MAKKNSNFVYITVILLLLLLVVYLLYDRYKLKKNTKIMIEQIQQNAYEKDSLMNELEDIYQSYEGLMTTNDSLNKKIIEQKQHIQDLMQQLRHTRNVDRAKIKQLKEEVKTLRKILKSYIRQVDSLYEQNQILLTENRQIKHQYQQVVEEKEQLTQMADSLKKTVKEAQYLTAYYIEVKALNKRDKKTRRHRRTRKFEVCFTLSQNRVAPKGKKKIYLRIAKPDGEILLNSKSQTFTFEGKEIYYSSYREIDYDGNAQNLCIYYDASSNKLVKGTYTVFIFADGVLIGDKKITLK